MGAGEKALDFVEEGQVIGLGTGRAATAFVRALGERIRWGKLRIRGGVATSERTAALARELGIPLLPLEEAGLLDLCVDGADEVAPNLDLIKGYGGALVREKIVAASARRFVVLVGAEKLVKRIGERGRLPVEIVPFALPLCERRLHKIGCVPSLRMDESGERPYLTDNGNYILDAKIAPQDEPDSLQRGILRIPGTVDTGLFLGMADAVIVEHDGGERVEVLTRT